MVELPFDDIDKAAAVLMTRVGPLAQAEIRAAVAEMRAEMLAAQVRELQATAEL